jgi:hypothetical protein
MTTKGLLPSAQKVSGIAGSAGVKLDGRQIKRLVDALTAAYPNKDALRRMVRYDLNVSLETIVDANRSLEDTVFDLITQWAEPEPQQRRTDRLIEVALSKDPENQDLKEIQTALKASPILESRVLARVPLVGPTLIIHPQSSPFGGLSEPQATEEDPDLEIGKRSHPDYKGAAVPFLSMIKRPRQQPFRVLAIQAPKSANLDSLVTRFVEMCKQVEKPDQPLLYTKIILGPAWEIIRACPKSC